MAEQGMSEGVRRRGPELVIHAGLQAREAALEGDPEGGFGVGQQSAPWDRLWSAGCRRAGNTLRVSDATALLHESFG